MAAMMPGSMPARFGTVEVVGRSHQVPLGMFNHIKDIS
jgi:hypothetical protein